MRKPQRQPKLASLSAADREQLADWLRHQKYDDVLERVNKPRPEGFGLSISKSPLQTFHVKVGLLDAINARLPEDRKISLAFFETLGTRAIDYLTTAENDKSLLEAHQSILNASVDLTAAADNTPNRLATLQRLIDFPARAEIRAAKEERAEEMHAHKIALDLRKESHKIEIDKAYLHLAERNTTLREARATRPNQNPFRNGRGTFHPRSTRAPNMQPLPQLQTSTPHIKSTQPPNLQASTTTPTKPV